MLHLKFLNEFEDKTILLDNLQVFVTAAILTIGYNVAAVDCVLCVGFVVPAVIASFADCLRLWHILVQQTEVRAPRRPVVAARLLDAVSSWQTCMCFGYV